MFYCEPVLLILQISMIQFNNLFICLFLGEDCNVLSRKIFQFHDQVHMKCESILHKMVLSTVPGGLPCLNSSVFIHSGFRSWWRWRMRSVMVVSGGEKGPRSRVGPMRWLLCLGGQHMEDPVDANPGVWLQSFQLLDMEHNDQVCPSRQVSLSLDQNTCAAPQTSSHTLMSWSVFYCTSSVVIMYRVKSLL